MRIAFDTNVVGYAEGLDDDVRHRQATALLDGLRHHELVLPVQVAAELHRLLMRRRRMDARAATAIVRRWQGKLTVHPDSSQTVFETALGLAANHHLRIFDAIILAASAEAGCQLLLSEDMQGGFSWRGTTVVNPFAPTPHPLLADALRP